MVKDPVCGMDITSKNAVTGTTRQGRCASREHMGQTFYFCSPSCVEQFDKDPHRYVMTSATTGFNPERMLTRIEFPVSGLPLKEHATHLESALRAVNGVDQVKVNRAASRLEVRYDAQKVDVSQLVGAIKVAGFQAGLAKIKIGIENLRCASCVRFIEDELKSTSGVLNANVNIGTQEATVDYLPEKTTLAQLNAAIETWGYKPRATTSDEPVDKQEQAHTREYRRLMNKFWFAAAISLPVMATAYYQFIPFLNSLSMDTLRLLWGITAVLTLPVMFWSGSDFFSGGWQAFKHRSANMNTLIALGTAAAWLYSTFAISFPAVFPEGTSEPFYDVVSVVIALVVLGQALELRAKGQSGAAMAFSSVTVVGNANRLRGFKPKFSVR